MDVEIIQAIIRHVIFLKALSHIPLGLVTDGRVIQIVTVKFLRKHIKYIYILHHSWTLKHQRLVRRHQMETISALLVVCAGNSPVTGEFPTLRQVAQSFDVFMIGAWTNGWESNRDAGDLRGHCGAHYYVTVMNILYWIRTKDIHISCNVHHGCWWSGGMSSYSIPISAPKGLVFLSKWLLCVTLPFEEPELEVTSMAEIKNPKQSKSNTKYNRKNNDNTEI